MNERKCLISNTILIIFSYILLIIGKNNFWGWLIFSLIFLFLYFIKNKLISARNFNKFFLWFVTIMLLCLSFSFTRPLPSIRGLIFATLEILNAKALGSQALNINPNEINNFIVKQRKTSENAVRNYKVPTDIIINKAFINNTNCEWVSIKNAPSDKVIIYLHGGAYITGNLDTSRPFAVRIAKASGYKVLVVEYALAPEHPYPTCVDQTLDVYHSLLNQGILPSKIAILGDSAGGGLEFATVLSLKERHETLPNALICISPWFDLTSDPKIHGLNLHQGEFDWYNQNVKLYAVNESLLNPYISPMYGNYKDFPPLLILAGDVDILIHDIRKVADKAKTSGVNVTFKEYKGMYHDFATSGDFIPESKESVNIISQFIKMQIK